MKPPLGGIKEVAVPIMHRYPPLFIQFMLDLVHAYNSMGEN